MDMNFNIDFSSDSFSEIIAKISGGCFGLVLGCLFKIALTGLWVAIALWSSHSFGLLLTITFSWKLVLLVYAVEWLIRHCFK